MYDEFEEDQAKTSKRAPTEAMVHPFLTEVEAVQDGMTTAGIIAAAKPTPEPRMETDVFGDTVTQSKELMPLVEIKKGKQTFFFRYLSQ